MKKIIYILMLVLVVGLVSATTMTDLSLTSDSDFTINTGANLFLQNDIDITGSLEIHGSPVRLSNDTNLFFYDTGDEAKHLNSFAESYDELRVNTFVHEIYSEIFSNTTGQYVTLSTGDEHNMNVVLSDGDNANVLSFGYNNVSLELNIGTDNIPVLNYIYAKDVAGTPTWYVTSSMPTGKYAIVGTILVGAKDTIYGASLKEDITDGAIKKIQQVFKQKGLVYVSGFDYNATATNVSVDSGVYIGGITPTTLTCDTDTNDFYLIDNANVYQKYTDISDIDEYSNGESISNDKYFNVVWGIIPNDANCNLYAVVQTLNKGEYGKLDDALINKDNNLISKPNDSFLGINFLPIVQTVIKKGTGIQEVSTDIYGINFRGGVANSGSSGGGVSETDPIWIAEKTDYYLKTAIDTQGEVETIWGVNLATDSEIVSGLSGYYNSEANLTGLLDNNYIGLTTNFGGDVSGTYGAIVVADDSHNHIYSNIDATTSANWANQFTDETGTGVFVLSDSPTFTGEVNVATLKASGTIESTVASGKIMDFENGCSLQQNSTDMWFGC